MFRSNLVSQYSIILYYTAKNKVLGFVYCVCVFFNKRLLAALHESSKLEGCWFVTVNWLSLIVVVPLTFINTYFLTKKAPVWLKEGIIWKNSTSVLLSKKWPWFKQDNPLAKYNALHWTNWNYLNIIILIWDTIEIL